MREFVPETLRVRPSKVLPLVGTELSMGSSMSPPEDAEKVSFWPARLTVVRAGRLTLALMPEAVTLKLPKMFPELLTVARAVISA